jgi:hypothetical protein
VYVLYICTGATQAVHRLLGAGGGQERRRARAICTGYLHTICTGFVEAAIFGAVGADVVDVVVVVIAIIPRLCSSGAQVLENNAKEDPLKVKFTPAG